MKIVLEKVSKEYVGANKSKIEALKNISLTINKEEFVILVGPSGCGKSTILNMISGLVNVSSGKIYAEDLNEDRDVNFGMVFQEIGLFPWRTVFANIAFGLEETGLTSNEIQSKVDSYIELVGLNDFKDSYPHQLSGGMRQRVGIARALAIEPDMLLMDEPFSALDAQTRILMQDELLRLWAKHKLSTLYVTHNIEEAVSLGDKIIVLSRRPATIIDTIVIEEPQEQRKEKSFLSKAKAYEERIWQLIKADAERALKEEETSGY